MVGSFAEHATWYLNDNSWQEEVDEFAELIVDNKPVINGNSADAAAVMSMVYRIYHADERWRAALLGEQSEQLSHRFGAGTVATQNPVDNTRHELRRMGEALSLPFAQLSEKDVGLVLNQPMQLLPDDMRQQLVVAAVGENRHQYGDFRNLLDLSGGNGNLQADIGRLIVGGGNHVVANCVCYRTLVPGDSRKRLGVCWSIRPSYPLASWSLG